MFSGLGGVGASSTGLWLLTAGTIRFVGGAGVTADLPENVGVMEFDAPMPGPEAVRDRRIVMYGSVEERDRRWPALSGVATAAQATAVLPLTAGDRILGCLHIGYPERMDPGDFDLAFLHAAADLCAAALDRAQLHDAERARQALLLEASTAVANADSFQEALVRLAEIAVPALADLCLVDAWEDGGRIVRMAAVHADPSAAPLVEELGVRYPPEPGGRHPASVAMAEGRSIWAEEMPEEFMLGTTRDERHLELTRRLGFTSFISVPLIVAGETLGAITLVSAGSGRRFGRPDLLLAEELADQIADVVYAARRHGRQHELAHVLQTLLLPAGLPDIPGLDACARYLTARRDAEAGGDFYDLVRLPSGRIGFVIGDVEGHDPEAAAVMGQLRSAIRALAGQHREPHLLIDALRWSWDLLGFTRMATCLVGRLDLERGDLVICSAGHPPPLMIGADGTVEQVMVTSSPPLGAPAGPSADTTLVLQPGATLFLYTDGLVESPDRGIDEGMTRLAEVLSTLGARPTEELCEKVLASRPAEEAPADDVAMLALRLEAGAIDGRDA